MLNRELLQYTRNSGRISVRFLKKTPAELNIAGALLDTYSEAARRRLNREVLDENLEPFLKAALQGKTAAGMNKVILDHCEFVSQSSCENMAEERNTLFKIAAGVLADPPENPEEYRRRVQALMGKKEFFAGDIYGDLPEFDHLSKVPEWNAEELCNIYNVNLVQSLLLYAESLELFLADPDPMTLRKFMRRLKFFRLLAEVEKISTHEVKLTVSGPAVLFGENRKYGLQLASFFQVILLMKEWKMRAKLRLRNDDKVEVLNLSSKNCDLKSSARRWATCVPEEVALFIRQFRNQAEHWQVAAEADLPKIANHGVIFPDFSFKSTAEPGKIIHVELFHRYYNTTLNDRLAFLQKNPKFPLVVGIDRFLLGNGGEKEFLERWSNIKDHLFFYSNYPGVEKVCRTLDKVAAL
ncbi:MAG: DUF790 family protein [Lentisphaeria bacterium]|nr:DUF790 family protein [Lentisphaeria bacterium]